MRHQSPRTEDAYVGWIRRFILLHHKRHPADMGPPEVAGFLSSLATARHVSASTQNQALHAVLFLHRVVLGRELEPLPGSARAHVPASLPVVLRNEIAEPRTGDHGRRPRGRCHRVGLDGPGTLDLGRTPDPARRIKDGVRGPA